MSEAVSAAEDAAGDAWADAMTAATLLAVDPSGLGGASLRAPPGPVRDRWLALLRAALPPRDAAAQGSARGFGRASARRP